MHVDLLLKNAKIADLFRLRLFGGWLGIVDNRFVYVEEGDPPPGLSADRVRDVGGRYLLHALDRFDPALRRFGLSLRAR